MTLEYVVAVPSHRRAELFQKKTLAWLRRTNVVPERVHLFLSDQRDVADYAGLVGNTHRTCAANVVEKFNAIHAHFAEGTPVLVLEDDVVLIEGADNVAHEVTDLDALVQAGFAAVGAGGIFGINPHSNSFFFSGKVSRTLKLIVAHAFGFVSTRDPALAVTQLGKSDYERTCRYFVRYGEVVRLNQYGVRTTSYTQAGGMQAQHTRQERAEIEERSCAWLVQHYPHLLARNAKKKSLFAELRFLPCKYGAAELQRIQEIVEAELEGRVW